ncbi:MAG: hypothetical protein RR214_00945 [Synergistaceae bacterium]
MENDNFISFSLNNEEVYLSRVSAKKRELIAVNKSLGNRAVCISLNGTGENPNSILHRMKEIQKQVIGENPAQ